MTLSACGGGSGGSPAAPPPPPVANANPNTPVLSSSIAMAYASQGILFTGSATDPNNLPLTYAWDFGDGSTGSGGNTSHSYIGAGVYTVSLTVRNSNGGTASGTIPQSIQLKAADTLAIDCVGPSCAALNATTYSGSGTGQWRYLNSTASDATININIAGVSQGNTVTLLFSNGNNASASTAPGVGVLAEPLVSLVAPLRADALAPSRDTLIQDTEDAAHSRLLEMNHALKQGILTANSTLSTTAALADTLPPPSQPSPAPALSTQRTWNDLFPLPAPLVPYSTTVQATCQVPNGRNVVIWVDTNTVVSPTTLNAFTSAYCGSTGGFQKLVSLLGDVWGNGAANLTNVIHDLPTLQDINIVIVPSSANWAGYFFGGNNFKSGPAPTFQPGSNEALVFFINSNAIGNPQVNSTSLKYLLSTLIHESTHMVNFYQRFIVQNKEHDTWLEETSAMMSEDIISPTIAAIGVNKIAEVRLPAYVQTGGNVSYINWPSLSTPNYSLGGAFGAYLNRRYGLAIYTQLLSNCNDPVGTASSSYTCLDSLIKAKGGLGFADDFAHFGASIFAVLPPPAAPSFYGYPAKADGGYSLPAIDVSAFTNLRPPTAAALSSGYTATTHTYKLDTVAAGKTSYVRNGVVVPANTILLMVIK